MTERELRRRLREHRLPDEEGAERRAWQLVSSAYAERRPAGRRASRRPRLAFAVVLLAALVAVGLSPPGEAVGEWIRDAVRPGRAPSRPALVSLPAAGRLLVESAQGPWIVQRDGSMRRLGDYDDASWSPGGRFVVATRGRQLVALDPKGDVRWSLTRGQRVSRPAWSPPDGFRVAYLSGRSLRVVAGDGTGDHLLARRVALTGPAWRPGRAHTLAYVRPGGGITVARADTRRRLWSAGAAGLPVIQLAWTSDGRRLVGLDRRGLRVFDSRGKLLATGKMPRGTRAEEIAIQPAGHSLVLIRHAPNGGSEVVSLSLRDPAAGERRLFAGVGRFTDLAWSPDGRWLLVAWRDADQWLLLRSARVLKVDAVSNIGRQFNPGGRVPAAFPRLGGWCCAR
jgi:WD40 repeat protein